MGARRKGEERVLLTTAGSGAEPAGGGGSDVFSISEVFNCLITPFPNGIERIGRAESTLAVVNIVQKILDPSPIAFGGPVFFFIFTENILFHFNLPVKSD